MLNTAPLALEHTSPAATTPQGCNSQDDCVTRGFPDLPQWTVDAVDRIVIGNWQSCDSVIGFWPFAGQTAKQITLASVRVSSPNAEVRTRADVVMRDTRRNENDGA